MVKHSGKNLDMTLSDYLKFKETESHKEELYELLSLFEREDENEGEIQKFNQYMITEVLGILIHRTSLRIKKE